MISRILQVGPLSAAVLALTPLASHAGSIIDPATVKASIQIVDDGNYTWTLNLSSFVAVDASTGAIGFNLDALKSSNLSAQGTDGGAWDVNGDGSVTWHSWTRQDGSIGSDTNGGLNKWRAVVTFGAGVLGGNVDPELSYVGATFQNNNTSAKQTFGVFAEGDIIPPTSGAFVVSNQISGTAFNNTQTGVGGTMTLEAAPRLPQDDDGVVEMQVLLLSSDGGSSYVNAGVDVGKSQSYSDGTTLPTVQHVFSDTDQKTVNGTFNYWYLESRVKLSAGDKVQLNGQAAIAAVPEPQSAALLAAGVGVLTLLARRRQG